jgi:hypothetical protein
VLIHTLGGLFDSSGNLINNGLAEELVQRLTETDGRVHKRRLGRAWVLNVDPALYGAVVRRWLAAEPRLQVHLQTRVVAARAGTSSGESQRRVLELQTSGPRGSRRWRPKAVIDATGSGQVVRALDSSLVEDDPQRAAGGWILRLSDVVPGTLVFPRSVAILHALRRAVQEGALPPLCANAWIDTGMREDEAYVKLAVPLGSCDREEDAGNLQRQLLPALAALLSFLKGLQGFARVRVSRTGRLGIRDGGRVRGEYCLSTDDVRQAQKFQDAACRSCWPIEFWDPAGGVSLEYLPESAYYEIPLRCLRVQGFENLWCAGKCLSADRYAQASARVVGTCWAMGEAVGKAACGLARRC